MKTNAGDLKATIAAITAARIATDAANEAVAVATQAIILAREATKAALAAKSSANAKPAGPVNSPGVSRSRLPAAMPGCQTRFRRGLNPHQRG